MCFAIGSQHLRCRRSPTKTRLDSSIKISTLCVFVAQAELVSKGVAVGLDGTQRHTRHRHYSGKLPAWQERFVSMFVPVALTMC